MSLRKNPLTLKKLFGISTTVILETKVHAPSGGIGKKGEKYD